MNSSSHDVEILLCSFAPTMMIYYQSTNIYSSVLI